MRPSRTSSFISLDPVVSRLYSNQMARRPHVPVPTDWMEVSWASGAESGWTSGSFGEGEGAGGGSREKRMRCACFSEATMNERRGRDGEGMVL